VLDLASKLVTREPETVGGRHRTLTTVALRRRSSALAMRTF
jgi:hypothetical protein